MQRTVTASIDLQVHGSSDLIFSIAVAAGTPLVDEQLTVLSESGAYAVRELIGEDGTRLHRVQAEPGRVEVFYRASVGDDVRGVERGLRSVHAEELSSIAYLRQSRYCESDRLLGLARSEFRGLTGLALLHTVGEWVHGRLEYVSGSTNFTDSAMTTLDGGRGVCRDFAHLTIALLRALDVPARYTSVYAPGLAPMDFHAVAEAKVDGEWHVIDATKLAPRQSFVRIATGRDAADVAWLTNHGGRLSVERLSVTAVADILPVDDSLGAVLLA